MLSVIIVALLLRLSGLNPAPPPAGVFDGQDEVLAEMNDRSDARTSFDQCDGKPTPNQGLTPPRAYPECAGISWEFSAAIVVGQHKI